MINGTRIMERKKSNKIIFIGNARDFHAIDWYRSIKKICKDKDVFFATDLIYSEGHARLVTEDDIILPLYNIDWLLFKRQSLIGNIWRNFIKFIFSPLQFQRLKQIARNNPEAIFHAHTMYYLFLGWGAGIKYIGSPQGDEILIRPFRSKIYKYLAVKSLNSASHIIIDSISMQDGIRKLCGKESTVIQYGIDVAAIEQNTKSINDRSHIVSIRALYPLYRIHDIFKARDEFNKLQPLLLFYPFWEDGYKERILKMLQPDDINMERIPTKGEMYRVLSSAMLTISIPESDSSPRSVYESIFCGCCVAVTYNTWIENLPDCMRKRIYIVDINDNKWFSKAIEHAKIVVKEPYHPSEKALEMFDQKRSMKMVYQQFYLK